MAYQPISKERLAELLAKARANKEAMQAQQEPPPAEIVVSNEVPTNLFQTTDKYGNAITYNAKQTKFLDFAAKGESGILLGAAGTGKTTTMKGTVQTLIETNQIGYLPRECDHKYLPAGGYGVAIVAYTRRATNNIRRNVSEDVARNCITIHKLLEYEPVIYEEIDEKGNTVKKKVFEPKRNAYYPLPEEIKVIIFEESSMVSTELYEQVVAAAPHNPTYIFLGDIQQLPPVFGSAILGYKMLELPTVELTEVYRQALESPIIRLAHRILSGKGIPDSEFPEWNIPNQLKLHPWKKRLSADVALHTAAKFFTTALDNNAYNPEDDIILIPYNKSFGTDELNKFIAQHIARRNGRKTYEIIAGFNKHYLSIGDKVLYDKEDAIVIDIKPNPTYSGKRTQPASFTLDYWGYDPVGSKQNQEEEDMTEEHIDFLLEQVANMEDSERVRQASHSVVLQMQDTEREVTIDTASAINGMILGYAITVHKSQGSEWDKVFLVLHQSHATMIQRELLYTAVTRAKKELYVICEPDSFVKGIDSQRIKGNSLEEKIEYFKGKQDDLMKG